MCCCDDGNYCQFFVEDHRTARKPHRCSECRRDIAPGERYKAMSGRWRDSGFEAFCWCGHCEAAHGIVDAFLKERFDAIPRNRRWNEKHWCWCYHEMWDSAREEVRGDPAAFPRAIVRLVLLGYKRKWTCRRGPRRGELVPVPVVPGTAGRAG